MNMRKYVGCIKHMYKRQIQATFAIVEQNDGKCTRWFKYDRDDLCVNKSQFVPVIFEPPCI